MGSYFSSVKGNEFNLLALRESDVGGTDVCLSRQDHHQQTLLLVKLLVPPKSLLI